MVRRQVMFTQANDSNNKTKGKSQFWKNENFCHNSNHSVPNFRKFCGNEETKRNSYSRSKFLVKTFIQNLKT